MKSTLITLAGMGVATGIRWAMKNLGKTSKEAKSMVAKAHKEHPTKTRRGTGPKKAEDKVLIKKNSKAQSDAKMSGQDAKKTISRADTIAVAKAHARKAKKIQIAKAAKAKKDEMSANVAHSKKVQQKVHTNKEASSLVDAEAKKVADQVHRQTRTDVLLDMPAKKEYLKAYAKRHESGSAMKKIPGTKIAKKDLAKEKRVAEAKALADKIRKEAKKD